MVPLKRIVDSGHRASPSRANIGKRFFGAQSSDRLLANMFRWCAHRDVDQRLNVPGVRIRANGPFFITPNNARSHSPPLTRIELPSPLKAEGGCAKAQRPRQVSFFV